MTNLITFVEDGVPFIKSESVAHGTIDFENVAYITDKVHRLLTKSFVYTGDILFTKIGAIGRVALYDGRLGTCNSNAATAKIQVDALKAHPQFVAYQLGSERVMREFEKTIISMPPRINLGDINSMEIECPPLPEQRKIARILTTVDNLIEQTEALIEKYKSIKQGMMHDLFTRGVDSNGQLRPPYEDAPHLYKESALGWIPKEWEVGPLKTIASLVGGFAFSSIHARDNGVRWLKIANVGFEKANWNDISYLPHSFLSIHMDFSLNPGDMVMAMTRPIIRGALKIAVLTNEDTPALLNQRVGRLDVQRSEDSQFVYFAIQLPHTIEQLENKTLGTDPPNLSSSQVESSIIQIPPADERIRISERLNAISSKLEAERRCCSRLLTLKTGLMQDLLTGNVRVNVDEAEEVTADV